MHYTYVLLSQQEGGFYTGSTANQRKRLGEHQRGPVRWTASRQPVRLVYYEAWLSKEDSLRRERFLKSGKGKRDLRNRLKAYLSFASRTKSERH